MKIELIPSIEFIKENELNNKLVVIIDVLRATSVITTALNNGAKAVIAKIEIEEALVLKNEKSLLGGERKALKIEGFDLSNSPLDYKREIVENKIIILTTTNGTKTIHRSLSAHKIIIGCMLNSKAIAKYIAEQHKDVVIICAGTYGKFSLDDYICAGKIIYEVIKNKDIDLDDFAATAYMSYRDNKEAVIAFVRMASHYKYLVSIGLEDDVKYCFTEDIIDIVPQVATVGEEIVITVGHL